MRVNSLRGIGGCCSGVRWVAGRHHGGSTAKRLTHHATHKDVGSAVARRVGLVVYRPDCGYYGWVTAGQSAKVGGLAFAGAGWRGLPCLLGYLGT